MKHGPAPGEDPELDERATFLTAWSKRACSELCGRADAELRDNRECLAALTIVALLLSEYTKHVRLQELSGVAVERCESALDLLRQTLREKGGDSHAS